MGCADWVEPEWEQANDSGTEEQEEVGPYETQTQMTQLPEQNPANMP